MPSASEQSSFATWRVCAAAAIALAVAMGIGRFAFTPQLPLMQRDGLLDAVGGAWLAAANYTGYLIGALLAARLTDRPRRLVLGCLFATAVITGAAGLTQGLPAWLLLRAAAGALSAWVLVGVSTWSIGVLQQRSRADASGWVFSGVGFGIAAVGALAWIGAGMGSASLWLALGTLALLAALVVQQLWPQSPQATAVRAPSNTPAPSIPPGSGKLIFCYGSFGFGYILPATYLPALARALVDDPRLFGLAWPLFGLAAAASTLLAGLALRRWRLLGVWSSCHVLMAAGNLLPLLSRSGGAIALAALLVGGTFMVATMTGLQQARALAPANPAPLLARMTAAFALGQIGGPVVALALDRVTGASGIEVTLAIAAALLCITALWLRQTSTSTETSETSVTSVTSKTSETSETTDEHRTQTD